MCNEASYTNLAETCSLDEIIELIQFHAAIFLHVPGKDRLKDQHLRIMELDNMLFAAKIRLDKDQHKQAEWNRVDWEMAERLLPSRSVAKVKTSTLTLDDLGL